MPPKKDNAKGGGTKDKGGKAGGSEDKGKIFTGSFNPHMKMYSYRVIS